jgi:hypothetical protein
LRRPQIIGRQLPKILELQSRLSKRIMLIKNKRKKMELWKKKKK